MLMVRRRMGFIIIMRVKKYCKLFRWFWLIFSAPAWQLMRFPCVPRWYQLSDHHVRLCCHIALATNIINQDCFYKIYPGDFEAKERTQNLSFIEVAVKLKIYFHRALIKEILRFRVLIKFIELSFQMAWAYWREVLSFQRKHLPREKKFTFRALTNFKRRCKNSLSSENVASWRGWSSWWCIFCS